MGLPLAQAAAQSAAPAAGERANALLSGTFTAIGPSNAVPVLGTFNALVWATINHTLTTLAGSLAASVDSQTGLVVGMPIKGANVPPGTTIGALPGGNVVTLALPPGSALATVLVGADAAAQFGAASWVGTVQLERSFDGGLTWIVCNTGGAGAAASYTGAGQAGVAVSLVGGEPESGVAYRWNCTAWTNTVNVTINYRISQTSPAATAWGIPPS